MARQAWCRHERLDRANKIEMLGRCGEGLDLQPSDRQKNTFRFAPERGGGSGHTGDVDPAIGGFSAPSRARQTDKRNFRHRRRNGRVARDLFGEWMRGIDEHVDALGFDIGSKPLNAAKASNTRGNLRHARRFGAAGKRQYGGDAALPGKQARELACFQCPAEQEYPHRLSPKLSFTIS